MCRTTSVFLGLGLFLLVGTAAMAQAPAAPSNLTATAVSQNQINLFWQDNSNNEQNFVVELRTATTAYQVIADDVPANAVGAQVFGSGLSPGTTYFFRVKARNASGDSAYSNEAFATTPTSSGNCTESPTTLCLNNGRFRVQATFQTPAGQSGNAQVVKLTDESGYLWFFSSTNVEVVLKVLNACSFNDRYWFFAAGLTNVRVVITVTDTSTGTTKTYINPLNRAFPPIQDTSAFNTCP